MRGRNLHSAPAATPSSQIWDGTIKITHNPTGETHRVKREFVSFKEAKDITGISDWTWREWADLGKCASIKMGHRILIPVTEITRLLSAGYRPALPQSLSKGGAIDE